MNRKGFASRGGFKLERALISFELDVAGLVCADLGANAGGFVDCLLQRGAAKVYAVETGYGVLEWKLRNDPRVVVMERTNALRVDLPEKVKLITIDVAWTRQRIILPAAKRLIAPMGSVVTLIKPHYEAAAEQLRRGVLPEQAVETVVENVKKDVENAGFNWIQSIVSPIKGASGNVEVLVLLRAAADVTH